MWYVLPFTNQQIELEISNKEKSNTVDNESKRSTLLCAEGCWMLKRKKSKCQEQDSTPVKLFIHARMFWADVFPQLANWQQSETRTKNIELQ